MYLFMRVKSFMGLKVRGFASDFQNYPVLEAFQKIIQKVNSFMGIRRFSYNFREICSKTRVSELESAEKLVQVGPRE